MTRYSLTIYVEFDATDEDNGVDVGNALLAHLLDYADVTNVDTADDMTEVEDVDDDFDN